MSKEEDKQAVVPTTAYLPYPASTLSPAIVPHDLTSFKSLGISRVNCDLQLRMEALQKEYRDLIDHYNWNKLVYESKFNFEPRVGETYHLYQMKGDYVLSMVEPEEWPQKFIASLLLNVDRQWELIKMAPDIVLEELFKQN